MKTKINIVSVKTYFWWIFAGVLGIITVFLTIETSTSGFEIAKLQNTSNALIQENRDLSDSVINNMSLTSIEKKKDELGFIKPDKVVYINENVQVAKIP